MSSGISILTWLSSNSDPGQTQQPCAQTDPRGDIPGSAQRLPSGNTVIAEPLDGRAFEVTPDGDIVWDWRTWETYEDEVMPLYRAYKVDPAIAEGMM